MGWIRAGAGSIVVGLAVGLAPPVWATMEFTSDDRYLSNFEEGCDQTFSCTANLFGFVTPAPAFSDFDTSLSGYERQATQTSTLGPGLITASGSSVDGFFSSPPSGFFIGNQSTTSLFEVTLELDTTMQVDMVGSLSVEGSTADTGWATFRLVSAALGTIVSEGLAAEDTGDATLPFTHNVLLNPGTYTLRVGAGANFAGGGTYDLTVNAASVPEPGTGWMIGLAVLVLARARSVEPS